MQFRSSAYQPGRGSAAVALAPSFQAPAAEPALPPIATATAAEPAAAPAPAPLPDAQVQVQAQVAVQPMPLDAAPPVPIDQLDAHLTAGLSDLHGQFDEHGLPVEPVAEAPSGGGGRQIEIDGEAVSGDEDEANDGEGGGGGGKRARRRHRRQMEAQQQEHEEELGGLRRQLLLYKQKVEQGETRLARLRQRGDALEAEKQALADEIADMKVNWQPKVMQVVKDEGELRRRREEARRRMLTGALDEDEEDGGDELSGGARLLAAAGQQRSLKRLLVWLARHMPLQEDVRKTQVRYGSAVSAYFAFFRWIVVTYIWLFVLAVVPLVLHLVHLAGASGGSRYLGVSGGWQPKFLTLASFQYEERVLAVSLLMVCNSVVLFQALRKWVREDRLAREVATYAARDEFSSARLVLGVWDHAQDAADEVADQRAALGGQIHTTLVEAKAQEARAARSQRERMRRLARRVAANAAYGVAQLLGWATIIYLSSQGDWLRTVFSTSVAASVVPATVTVINGVMPHVVAAVTAFEQRDFGSEVMRVQVMRLFVAKTLNVVVQMLAYALLADPYMLTQSGPEYRSSLAQEFSAADYDCRAEQTGMGLTQLVLTEFVLSKVLLVAVPAVKKRAFALVNKPVLRQEFNVSLRMVSLIYFQALIFLAFPLSPFSLLLATPMLLLHFKFEMWALGKYWIKPRTPFNAEAAGSFFIKFYVATLLLGVAVTHVFLSQEYLPKECALQDDAVGLCVAGSYDAATQLCTLDTSNVMADSFDEPSECAEGYPLCVCAHACGPFTRSTSAYHALEAFFDRSGVFGWLYDLFAREAVFAWALFLAVALAFRIRGNMLGVVAAQQRSVEEGMQVRLSVMQKKLDKQQGQLEKQRKALQVV